MFILIGLIVTLLISSLLLALTGTLSPLGMSFFGVCCVVALFVISYQRHQNRHRLVFRSHELGASSSIAVRHLGGLPFPIPTVANLFLSNEFLRVETEHDSWQVPRTNLNRMVIMSAEQIHQITDQEIIQALSGGTSRLLSLVREKIRRGDSTIRRSKLLFLTLNRSLVDPIVASDIELEFVQNEIIIFSFSDIENMKKIVLREELADFIVDFQPDAG